MEARFPGRGRIAGAWRELGIRHRVIHDIKRGNAKGYKENSVSLLTQNR